MTAVKRLSLALLLALAACDDPDVDRGLTPTDSSVISGDAVIAIPIADPHPVVLFLVMVADGSGSPLPQPTTVNVTVIPESDLAEGGNGVRTGPFEFGLVSPAAYIVQGIVDMDDNFNLLVPAQSAPTAADLRGGHADVVSGELITIPVGPNEVVGEVTVMFAIPPGG